MKKWIISFLTLVFVVGCYKEDTFEDLTHMKLVQLDPTRDEEILGDTEDHSRTNENLPDALSPAERVLFAHEVGELASQNSHFESGLSKFGTPRFNLGKKEDFFNVAFVPFVNNTNETKAVLVGQYLGTSQQRIGIIKRMNLLRVILRIMRK